MQSLKKLSSEKFSNNKKFNEKQNKFCWNTIWEYIKNKSLRNYIKNAGIVMKVTVLSPGSGYIKNKTVCTFNEYHKDCLEIDTLKVDLKLMNGEIISAKPSENNRGFFYKTGDIVLVKGGNNDAFLKISRTWPK